jgi:hypothetical protein
LLSKKYPLISLATLNYNGFEDKSIHDGDK